MAVQALQARQVQRIILTRPAVEAGERLGFLPGDLMAKIDPYLRPLYDALYDMVDPEGAKALLERGTVEVAPLAFMRGRTLNNSFIILDEAQNTTPEQMKMFLTRIGFGSKVVVTGDDTQVDVQDGRSGLKGLERVLAGIDQLAFVHLTAADVVRHQIVADIVAAYERDTESRTSGLQARPQSASAHLTMSEPASPTGVSRSSSATSRPTSTVDADRWAELADSGAAGRRPHRRADADVRRPRRDRRAQRRAHGQAGSHRRAVVPARLGRRRRSTRLPGPSLLGDVVVCPAVASDAAPTHAGTLDDELALLVVHGILHVLGHDHAEPDETRLMRERELATARRTPLARPGAGSLPRRSRS